MMSLLRRLLLIAIIFVPFVTVISQPHWRSMHGPIDSSGMGYFLDFNSIVFPGFVFTASPDGTILVGTQRGWQRTTDKGATWTTPSYSSTWTRGTICTAQNGSMMIGLTNSLGDPIGGSYPFQYSLDNGATWLQSPSAAMSVPHLSVTIDTSEFVVPTEFSTFRGMERSTDGGINWLKGDTTPKKCLSLCSDGHRIYAGQSGMISVSTDGAQSWQNCPAPPNNFTWIAATATGAVVAITDSKMIMCSKDFGEHWIASNCPTSGSIYGLVASITNRFVLATDSGLFVSDTAVAVWQRKLNPFATFLTVHAGLNGVAYANCRGTLFESVDGGESWSKCPTGFVKPATVTAIAEDSSGTMFAGAGETGFYAGSETGAWRHVSDTMDGSTFDCLLVTPNNVLLAGIHSSPSAHAGLWNSLDGGATWHLVALQDSEVYSLMRDSSGNLYAKAGGAMRLYRSTDEGRTWSYYVNEEFLTNQTGIILVSNSGHIFIGKYLHGPFGLIRSRDHGATFDTTLFPSAVKTVVECPSALYAFYDRYVSRSTDKGDSWHYWDRGVYDSSDFKILVENSRGTLIACLSTNQIVVSYDHGATWTIAYDSIGGASIYTLFVSKAGNVFAGTSDGIYVFIDSIQTGVAQVGTMVGAPTALNITPSPVLAGASVRWHGHSASMPHVFITDMLGKVVQSMQMSGGGDEFYSTVAMAAAPTGMYTCIVVDALHRDISRFVHLRQP